MVTYKNTDLIFFRMPTFEDELKKPTEELIANVWDALSQLDDLWTSVSMDMSSRVQRVSYAYKNLNKLLAEIVCFINGQLSNMSVLMQF